MFRKTITMTVMVFLLILTTKVSAQIIDTAFQSVVQVMSYDAIYGKYPILRGRGSAAIISPDGLILTNNHVISKENGNPLTTFAICISTSISSRPDCKYTASLLSQDDQKDIALLRIDATDINGSKVDFSKFVPLLLYTDYIPKAQDKTLAIGYPSVGADTITQTVGVVAGTQQYNDATYIKTDTAIAPGNSGGPLLKDGKIIGINTFTMGGALGYALLISEAVDFIKNNTSKSTTSSPISTIDFQSYLKRADQIQNNKSVSDKIFSLSFSKPYVITNYIPNLQIEGQLQNPDDVNVGAFMIKLVNTIPMNSYDDFLYILRTQYGYDPSYQTLQKEIVGGVTMYSFVMANDLSQGEGDGNKIYLSQYGTSTVLELILILPSLDSTTKQAIIKKNTQEFLDNLKITPGYNGTISQKLMMNNPVLQLLPTKGMFTNIVDTADNYTSSRGSYTSPFAVLPLNKTSHENITYTLIDNTVELGSTKTLEEKFTITTEGISMTQKLLLTYMGNPGYAFCTEQSTDAAIYDDSTLTRQGNSIEMGLCRIVLYIGENESTILHIDLNVEKSKLRAQQRKLLNTIKKTLTLPVIGDGETTLPLQIMKSNKPMFTDTQDQDDKFNAYLNLLGRYGIIPKTQIIGLETPMTYRSYLALYLKAIYNITEDKTDAILKVAGINPDAYVDRSYRGLLATLISLRMANVQLPSYSPKDLLKFELLSQSTYRSDWKKIEEFEYSIYGDTKFSLDKVLPEIYSILYMEYNNYTFDPVGGLQKHIIYNKKGSLSTPTFGSVSNISQQDTIIQCANKPSMDKKCMQFHKKLANDIIPTSILGYEVLTLGRALDSFVYSIDVGLFDEQWKAKKSN